MGVTQTSTRLRVQPAIAGRVIDLLLRGDGHVELGALVRADPSLCAVVVRAANSAHLGLSRRVGSVRQAMVLLGHHATTALAVARTADLVFEDASYAPRPPGWVWPHAIASAAASAWVARSLDGDSEASSTTALLQNLLVPVGEAHDTGHTEPVATLLESWNFPASIVGAVRRHHASLTEVVAPLDRAVVCGRAIAAEAGLSDGLPVPSTREVLCVAHLSRSQLAAGLREVERSLDAVIRLAGGR